MRRTHFTVVLLAVVGLSTWMHIVPAEAEANTRRQQVFGRSPNSQFFFQNPFVNQFGFARFPSVLRKNGNLTTNFVALEGFSNVVKVGRSLFERHPVTGDLFRLAILNDGSLQGATDMETIRELVNFFVKSRAQDQNNNRSQFNANDRARIDAFLFRYGGFANGQFVFNMNVKTALNPADKATLKPVDGASPAVIASMFADPEMELNVSALNFLLNDVSQSGAVIRTDQMCKPADGYKELACDLRPFFRQDALNLIAQSDPLAACTGGRIRLNAVVQSLTDTNNYYRMVQAPKTKDQFALDFGISPRKEGSLRNKIVISDQWHQNKDARGGLEGPAEPESGVVTDDSRLLEFQPINRFQVRAPAGYQQKNPYLALHQAGRLTARGMCYGSYDTKSEQDQNESWGRDIFKRGITFAHDAEEWLCLAPNGVTWRRYLFTAAGVLLNEAPRSVVTQRIEAGRDCLSCHAQPILGGGGKIDRYKPEEQYHDNFDKIPHGHQFFTRNVAYRAIGDDVANLMLGNQREARAIVMWRPKGDKDVPFPLITKLTEKWKEPLDEEQAAEELGLPKNAFKGRFTGPGYRNGTIPRRIFESIACNLRSQVTGQGATGGPAPRPGVEEIHKPR